MIYFDDAQTPPQEGSEEEAPKEEVPTPAA